MIRSNESLHGVMGQGGMIYKTNYDAYRRDGIIHNDNNDNSNDHATISISQSIDKLGKVLLHMKLHAIQHPISRALYISHFPDMYLFLLAMYMTQDQGMGRGIR